MTRKRTAGPTDREGEILAILWDTEQADVEQKTWKQRQLVK